MSDIHPALSGTQLAIDKAIGKIPEDFQLRLTEAAAQYLNQRWRLELSLKLPQHEENETINQEPKLITWSHILDQDMLDELQMVALCLAEAATTHRKMIMQLR